MAERKGLPRPHSRNRIPRRSPRSGGLALKRFARLYAEIDATTRTSLKVAALARYFTEAPEPDRLWTIALFSGRRPKRAVPAPRLRDWAAERAGLPLWLVEETYPVVGDLAETLALLLPQPTGDEDEPLSHWINTLRDLPHLPEEQRRAQILAAWEVMDTPRRFLFNKLITGGFRVGVSQKLMTRALAQATQRDEAEIAHRLMGDWTPDTTTWHALIDAGNPAADTSRPYPFCLAHPLDGAPEQLGEPGQWHAEWKWDGIRGQLIRRGGTWHLWSRGEELISESFPEFARTVDFIPDGTVIDGEILAWATDAPLPFAALQKRIGRNGTVCRVLSTRCDSTSCDTPPTACRVCTLELGRSREFGSAFRTDRSGLRPARHRSHPDVRYPPHRQIRVVVISHSLPARNEWTHRRRRSVVCLRRGRSSGVGRALLPRAYSASHTRGSGCSAPTTRSPTSWLQPSCRGGNSRHNHFGGDIVAPPHRRQSSAEPEYRPRSRGTELQTGR